MADVSDSTVCSSKNNPVLSGTLSSTGDLDHDGYPEVLLQTASGGKRTVRLFSRGLDGHYHDVASELGLTDLTGNAAVFADLALWWTKWADMRNYCARLDALIEALDVKTVAPTHGLVITDVARTMPKVKEGLLYGSSVAERGTTDASFGKKVPASGETVG